MKRLDEYEKLIHNQSADLEESNRNSVSVLQDFKL